MWEFGSVAPGLGCILRDVEGKYYAQCLQLQRSNE